VKNPLRRAVLDALAVVVMPPCANSRHSPAGVLRIYSRRIKFS
jgi:hypothetical protein